MSVLFFLDNCDRTKQKQTLKPLPPTLERLPSTLHLIFKNGIKERCLRRATPTLFSQIASLAISFIIKRSHQTKTNPKAATANPGATTINPKAAFANSEVTTVNPKATPTNPEATTVNLEVTPANFEATTVNPKATTANPKAAFANSASNLKKWHQRAMPAAGYANA
ncbi:MAG: hypothetical protein V7K47_18920 [Nostoc sp.]